MQLGSFTFKRLAVIAAIIVMGIILWYFSTIVIYIIISLLLSLLGRPIQALLRKIRIGSWSPSVSLIAIVTLIILFAVIGGLFFLVTPVIIGQLASVSEYFSNSVNLIDNPFKAYEDAINSSLPGANISFSEVIKNQFESSFSIDTLKNAVGYLAKMVVDLAVGTFCVAFITFFFLQDEHMFSKWIMSFIPENQEGVVHEMMESIYHLQVRYLVGISAESIVKFLILGVSFILFGLSVNAAIVAALICAVLNIVPYVGPIIGGAIALFIGVLSAPADVPTTQLVVSMLVALLVFQVIDNILLQPLIYASSVKAHPLEIFIVILMAGYIAGIGGMVLAIPVYTILRVLAKTFFSRFKVVRNLTVNL